MSFFTKYLGEKAQNLHDELVKEAALGDPNGVIAANISLYRENVDKIAIEAATAVQNYNSTKTEVDRLTAELTKYKTAVSTKDTEIEGLAEGSPERAAAEKVSDELYKRASAIKHDLEAKQHALSDYETAMNQTRADHEAAITHLQDMQNTLDEAKRQQDAAKAELARSEETKHRTEATAGLLHTSNAADIALNAIKANTAKLQAQTTANNMTTTALAGDATVNSDVEKALAAVDGKAEPVDRKARHADL